MKPTNSSAKKDKAKLYKALGIAAGIIALLLLIFFLFRGCSNDEDQDAHGNLISYDDSAIEGGWDEADTEEIIKSLNTKVEEGMINISMNTSPKFENGTAEGNIMIVNEGVNRYPQVVEISRNDTKEVIYKSKAIPVGSKIETAKLMVDLEKGTYDCTALFYNVDPASGEYLGCAGAIVELTVLN